MAFYGDPGSAPLSLHSSFFFLHSILGPAELDLSLAARADLLK